MFKTIFCINFILIFTGATSIFALEEGSELGRNTQEFSSLDYGNFTAARRVIYSPKKIEGFKPSNIPIQTNNYISPDFQDYPEIMGDVWGIAQTNEYNPDFIKTYGLNDCVGVGVVESGQGVIWNASKQDFSMFYQGFHGQFLDALLKKNINPEKAFVYLASSFWTQDIYTALGFMQMIGYRNINLHIPNIILEINPKNRRKVTYYVSENNPEVVASLLDFDKRADTTLSINTRSNTISVKHEFK